MMKKIIFLFLLFSVASVNAVRYRVCYFTNWAQNRPEPGRFVPEDIDVTLCTHLIYALSKVKEGKLESVEWNDKTNQSTEGMYKQVNSLKNSHPNLKTLLRVGSWSTGVVEMRRMLATYTSRNTFIDSAIDLLQEWGFDGLDLGFQFPGSRESPPEDKQRFSLLLKEFREEINKRKIQLLLSAAVSPKQDYIEKAYEVAELNRYLDFVNLMAYDYHGHWESVTAFNSPLQSTPGDNYNLEWSAKYWVSQGLEKNKLVIGLSTFGRCFKLAKRDSHGVGAATNGSCSPGPFTGEAGFLSYYEICHIFKMADVNRIYSETHKVPYLVQGDSWISYDNPGSFAIKKRHIVDNGYAGWMVFALDLDDFKGNVCNDDKPYPMIKALGI